MSSTDLRVPAFPVSRLTFLQGEKITLEQMKHNNVVVLESWATWCPPCRDSIPHLSSLNTRYSSRGVVFIGISSENKSEVDKFIKQMGSKMNYRVAIDSNNEMDAYSKRFNVNGIPHAYIIDHNGLIRYSGHPMEPQFESKLDIISNEFRLFQQEKLKFNEQKQYQIIPIKQLYQNSNIFDSIKISDLLASLKVNHIDSSKFLEKSEMIHALIEANQQQEIKIKSIIPFIISDNHTSISMKSNENSSTNPSIDTNNEYVCTGDSCQIPPAKPKSNASANQYQCEGDSCSLPSSSSAAADDSSPIQQFSLSELSTKSISELNKLIKIHQIPLPPGGLEKSEIVQAIHTFIQKQ